MLSGYQYNDFFKAAAGYKCVIKIRIRRLSYLTLFSLIVEYGGNEY